MHTSRLFQLPENNRKGLIIIKYSTGKGTVLFVRYCINQPYKGGWQLKSSENIERRKWRRMKTAEEDLEWKEIESRATIILLVGKMNRHKAANMGTQLSQLNLWTNPSNRSIKRDPPGGNWVEHHMHQKWDCWAVIEFCITRLAR